MPARRPLLPAFLLALAAPLAGAGGDAADPFAPGVRWTHEAPAAAPWMPRDVVLGAGGELVWVAPAGANPGLRLLPSGALASPAEVVPGEALPGAVGRVLVAAGDELGELFSAHQVESGAATSKRTEVRGYDAVASSLAGSLTPSWTHVLGALVPGEPRLACDPAGEHLVAAVHDPSAGPTGGAVRLERIDPATGALLGTSLLPGAALEGLAVAADGRAAVSAGLDLWVVGTDGSVLHHEALAAATAALALSPDGEWLVAGGFAGARVLRWGPTGYAEALSIPGSPGEIAARAAVSDGGALAAVAFWSWTSGADVRLATWDAAAGAALHDHAAGGAQGALQDFPAALEVTPDGRRVALGLWGTGDASPEVVLLDRDAAEPVLAASLPGSVLALDLDAGGTRIAVAAKAVHANQMGSLGSVLLLDTGERDLQVVGAPAPGADLVLALSAPASTAAVLGLGSPAPAPLLVQGAGLLHLDPARPLSLHPLVPDAQGRADLALPVPPNPALVGLPLACQAASLTDAGPLLSASAPRPALL